MKLQECNLNPTHILASPYIRGKPAEYWVDAREKNIIPGSLFMIYHNADYCSIDKAPSYLSDPERKLFSYLRILLDAMCSCFIETHEILPEIQEYEEKEYNPIKKVVGQSWDKNASKIQGRLFKLFIIELVSVLDLLAELVALLLPGIVQNLRLGQSTYSVLDKWVEQQWCASTKIITPIHFYAEALHKSMNAEKVKGESECDWYRLLQLYRNKLAHIGAPAIRKLIFHNEKGDFFKFLPKSWPFLWEKDIRLPGEEGEDDEKLGPELFERILIHQDIISFCKSCREKIFRYIDSGCVVLNQAYVQLKDSQLNEQSLSELIASERVYAFKQFVE